MNQPLSPSSARDTSPVANNESTANPTSIAIYAAPTDAPATAEEPTRVIHFRHVAQGTTQSDLVDLCSPYGKVTHILLLKNNQALVQFADLACAMQFIQHCGADKSLRPNVRGATIHPSYSSHKELTKGGLEEGAKPNKKAATQDGEKEEGESKHGPNRIILVTVHNVNQYTVNADTIYQVFHPFGTIEKIVMFVKPVGLQALVQYQDAQEAAKARQSLSGLSLYNNNICSLSVQYSNLTELTVHQNSDKSRDYTKSGGFTQGLLESPALYQPTGGSSQQTNGQTGTHIQPLNMVPREPEKTVLLVSKFNHREMGIIALLNLFSCYGFVLRIKIFRVKPDHALIEFANHAMANAALTNLKGIELYGYKLSVNFSVHSHINSNTSTTQGSNDRSDEDFMRDFSKTVLNRFSAKSNQRYMCQPTATLHISNISPSVSEEELEKVLNEKGKAEKHRVYEHNEKRMALFKYPKVSDAAEVLCQVHDKVVGGKSIKVAFSTNRL
ncbi:polypyrimidine tract-binding protein [Acrasis kona]|uniref:Polypyrimidine tract-binding protein n=1 Tax=Acrasis kona TaxID=1008807 RepID=A0AAW2Z510_9EUKA